MSAGSSSSDTIESKLADSEWSVLLAAEQSAESKWVDEEIEYWAANMSIDEVVVASPAARSRSTPRRSSRSRVPTLCSRQVLEREAERLASA